MVTAVERAGNQSGNSNEASATPLGQPLEQNTAGGSAIDVKQGQRGAQSFRHGTVGAPGYQITKVVLHLSRDAEAPNGDLIFSIGTGINVGAWSGSTVRIPASQVTNTSAGSTFTTFEVVYTTPVGPLSAGTAYYLNFENAAANGKAFYLEFAGGNTYANGTYYKELGDDGKDIWFQVWGGPGG